MALAVVIVWTSLLGIGALWLWLVKAATVIKVRPFTEKIEKLVVADCVDRAIKLCNAVPNAPVCMAIKRILKYANDRDRMDVEFQAAEASLFRIPEIWQKRSSHAMIAGLANWALFASIPILNGVATTGVWVCLLLSLLFHVMGTGSSTVMIEHYVKGRAALHDVRCMLYARLERV